MTRSTPTSFSSGDESETEPPTQSFGTYDSSLKLEDSQTASSGTGQPGTGGTQTMNVLQLLKKFGLGSGSRVPFADADNKALEVNLSKKLRSILSFQDEVKSNREHIVQLEKHILRTQDHIRATKALLSFKRSELETEQNAYLMTERIIRKIGLDKKQTMDEWDSLCARNKQRKENLVKRGASMDELAQVLELDKKLFETYDQKALEVEMDMEVTLRYKDFDDRELHHIETRQADLGAKLKTLRIDLDTKAMTTNKCQEALDRVSVEYRKVHQQRKELVSMWSESIEALKKKDYVIRKVILNYMKVREEVRNKDEEVKVLQEQLQHEKCSQKDVYINLNQMDRETSSMRTQIVALKNMYLQLKDSVIMSNASTRSCTDAIVMLKATLRQHKDNMKSMLIKEAVLKEKCIELHEQERHVRDSYANVDETITALENLEIEEEKAENTLQRRVELLRKFYWDKFNLKTSLEQDLVNIDTRMQRAKITQSTQLLKLFNCKDLKGQVSTKIYRVELTVNNITKRLDSVIYDDFNAGDAHAQDQIVELKLELAKQKDDVKFVKKGLTYLTETEKRYMREIAQSEQEKEKYRVTLDDIDIKYTAVSGILMGATKDCQKEKVTFSLRKVALKRVKDLIAEAREGIFTFSEHRIAVECIVKERKAEINMLQGLNRAKFISMRSCLSKLKLELNEMNSYVVRLKSSYETMNGMTISVDEKAQEEDSLAVRLQNARREKELMAEEHSIWEKRIQEALVELDGLANVLKITQSANEMFKNSLQPAAENSEEWKQLQQIDELDRLALMARTKARKTQVALGRKLELKSKEYSVLLIKVDKVKEMCEERALILDKASGEVHRQYEKIRRWNALINKVFGDVQKLCSVSNVEALELALKCFVLKEKFKISVEILETIIKSNPSCLKRITSFCHHHFALKSLAKVLKAQHSLATATSKPTLHRL